MFIIFFFGIFRSCRLLEHLIKSHPYQMLDHVAHLKELLDYFTFTHAKISSYLVVIILPLTKFSQDLQVIIFAN